MQLESRYDARFRVVFDAIRRLMTPTVAAPTKRIGFRVDGRSTSRLTRAPEPR
jgi:hypothetical protein